MSLAASRVSGHSLRSEGAAFDERGRRISGGMGGSGRAKCSCGAMSPVLLSSGQRRRWHREHKSGVVARGAA